MHISDDGLDIVKEFEGYVRALKDGTCVAYRCVVGHRNGQPVYDGKWTIGWGCTEGIGPSTRWSRQQAEDALRKEMTKFEDAVNRLVKVPLNQNQFDALCSFAYNVGAGALGSSTLLRRLNEGNYQGAADQLPNWTNSAGVHNVPGLVRRRREERALFLKPVQDTLLADEPLPMPQTVDPPSSSDEHEGAHAYLEEASSLYSTHGHLLRSVKLALPPGAIALWHWAADPLHACLLLAGVALVGVIGLESWRLYLRSRTIGG